MMKYGIIDVGGGLRGIYGAGVLDTCLQEGIHFDCCIGVSAGSANLSSYLAGQQGRNKPFYDDYCFRREYMSVGNLIKKHSYLDLEYVYGVLSNADGENPLDYPAMMSNSAEFWVVATDARTGQARYFSKQELHQDDYQPLMASCCIPVVDQPYSINGVPYFDGGLSDPVPLKKALELGCDRVAVILTKPADLRRPSTTDHRLARVLRHRYPAAADGMAQRAKRYNDAVDQAQKMERNGLACVVAPDDIGDMKTLTRDKEALDRLYEKGRNDAKKLVRWVQASAKT